jgi:AcrR family transcriptional regulator
MRSRPWRGDPPADDTEARERIITAAMRCIDRHGPIKTGLSDVAAELGITRQTVYRLYPSTDHLFQAVAVAAADTFVDRMVARVSDLTDPAEMLVECIAFTIEHLGQERYLSVLLPGRPALAGQQFTSAIPTNLTRTLLARLPIDWKELGIRQRQQDDLVEIYLRTLHSLLVDPGPPRSPSELRAFIRTWLTPVVASYASQSSPSRILRVGRSSRA